jgi:hypothetical protein
LVHIKKVKGKFDDECITVGAIVPYPNNEFWEERRERKMNSAGRIEIITSGGTGWVGGGGGGGRRVTSEIEFAISVKICEQRTTDEDQM